MNFKSIRWRLQFYYGVVLLAVLAAFGATAYALERNLQFRNIDAEFQKRMAAISNAMHPPRPGPPGSGRGGGRGRGRGPNDEFPNDGPPEDRPYPPPDGPGFQIPPEANLTDLFGAATNSYYYVIWGPEGEELTRSQAAPHDVPPPPNPIPGGAPPSPRMRGVFRELIHRPPGGEVVLVGHSIADELASLRAVAWTLALVGAGVLLTGLTGGWWIAARALRPVEEISATAVKIAAGDLSQRISASETDSELGRLAVVLNSTFSRLEAAFAQQRQFTADAAHELRTPISVIITQTQAALSRERAAADYRATVEACQRAAQRMRGLMESLLQLARLDAGQETIKQLPFDLSELTNDCVAMLAPMAETRRVKISCDLSPAPCLGDPERMSQVLTNLLSNAIEYTCEAGEIRITTEQQDGTLVLTVADTGEGIAPEDLPRIFERFYRADKSRSSGGHSGLGLAISRAIILAHGGSIQVASQPGVGTTFTVMLPASDGGQAASPSQGGVP